MGTLSFRQFLLKEAKNAFLEGFQKLVQGIQKDVSEADSEDLEDTRKEGAEKVLKALERLVNSVVKEGSYLESKELVDTAKDILKAGKVSDKDFEKFFEASLDSSKREKFEDKLRSDVADKKTSGKAQKEFEKDEKEETDKDIEKSAKAKGNGDDDLEKEVEKDAKKDLETVGKKTKILVGIVKKSDEDGEVIDAIIGETDMKAKELDGIEYEDALSGIHDAKKLNGPKAIANYIKKVGGTVVYFFDFDKKDKDEEYLKIVKV
jgi:hypothetical protein